MEMNQTRAIELLLEKMYFSEFESIDGSTCHPNGWNFYYWLFRKGIIDRQEYESLEETIKDIQD